MFDTSNDESHFLTDDSSSDDSDSDFDLSDPQAEFQLQAGVMSEDDCNDLSCEKIGESSEPEESSEAVKLLLQLVNC